MDTQQNKPPKRDTPTEHHSITLESIKTKRQFGDIILKGVFLILALLLITIIVSIIWNVSIFEKLIKYIQNHWGAFSLGLTIGIGSGKIPQIFKYFVND